MSGAPATAASRITDPVLRRQKPGPRYLKPRLTRGWAVCSFTRRVSRTEISQVQALRMRCSRAASAIGRTRVLLSPAGPIFADAGYACVGKNLEPVTPAPSQLPELVGCRGRHHRGFRFIRTWGRGPARQSEHAKRRGELPTTARLCRAPAGPQSALRAGLGVRACRDLLRRR